MTDSPAEKLSTPVDGVDVLGALSPSRAGDFMTCPLLYRYRTIDRFPEEPSADAVRGTLVHKVLEDLFDLPAAERTPPRAQEMVSPAWEALVETEPSVAELFEAPEGQDPGDFEAWLTTCRTVLDKYFELEDPTRLEPAERELYVETILDSKLLLRGFIDRIDVAPDGAIRVVDYKGLAQDTPLPTPTGWTTMGDVKVGDRLIAADGLPTRVTHKSAVHHRPCFRLTFRDGSQVVADNVHLWNVVHSERQRLTQRTVSTEELSALHSTAVAKGTPGSIWIRAAEPLHSRDVANLPIDPWLLGAWLGDGKTRGGSLTVGRDDIADMLTQIKSRWSGEVRVQDESTTLIVQLSDLATELGRAGLHEHEHIPPAYLRAGTQQRIDLLRGLLDTDGWWDRDRQRAGFTTASDELATNVIELLRTLGIHPQHVQEPCTNAVRPDRTWHVIEFTPTWFNPFALPRKALLAQHGATPMQETGRGRRILTAVDPVESVPTQCIAVDAPDSLYLCGDGFIPTHNTGRAPGEMFEAKALFQMKFYALVVWRTRGVIPAMLQLIYLGNGEILRYSPDEADLRSVERKIEAIWKAIRHAELTGDWRPRRSRLCDWCSYQDKCPEFGGEIPPLSR